MNNNLCKFTKFYVKVYPLKLYHVNLFKLSINYPLKYTQKDRKVNL